MAAEGVEVEVEPVSLPRHTWVKCPGCKLHITIPPEWRSSRVTLREAAAVVLKVHQKSCTLRMNARAKR